MRRVIGVHLTENIYAAFLVPFGSVSDPGDARCPDEIFLGIELTI